MQIKKFQSILKKSCREKIILYYLFHAIRGLVLPMTMFLTQKIIDSITTSTTLACQYILCLGLIFLVDLILFYSGNYLELLIKNRLEYDGGSFLLMRCGQIKYQYYENGEIYQKVQELINRYQEVAWEQIRSRAFALQLVGSLFGILYYLLSAGAWIFFLLLAVMLPPLFLSIYAAKREFVSWETFFPFYIKSRYLTELLTKRRNIREARIFQYVDYVEHAWEEALAKFNQGQIRSNLKPRYLAGFCVCLQYFVTIAVLFWLFPRIQEQTMTVGVFAAVAQAMWNFTGGFQYGIIQMAKGLEEGKLFHKKMEYFMELNLEEGVCENTLNSGDESKQQQSLQAGGDEKKEPLIFQSLVLTDIWYRYASKEPYILKGVNLEIKSGQRMALVGQNGSGKTTLIKILLGLLAPERGEIRLNGVRITDQNRSLLQKVTSAVFQDYIKYSLPLPESLSLGREMGSISEEEMVEMLGSCSRKEIFCMH